MNPMVDGWMGDDWFHNGAFRQQNMPYIYEQVVTRKNDEKWWTESFRRLRPVHGGGSAGEIGRAHGLEQADSGESCSSILRTIRSGSDQAMDKILAEQPLKVPVMLVAQPLGPGRYLRRPGGVQSIKPKDTNNDKVFLVLGPWHHGQEIEDGSSLGAIKFGSDTGALFPAADSAAISGSLFERRCAEAGCRAGHRV